MNTKGLLLLVPLLFAAIAAEAQISPGELSKAHASLEGMANCTKCHVLGEKVSNEKCLACHTEIKTRMDKGTGYHASREVRGKECAECHSDHHGRNFDMINLKKDLFNHSLTGFELTGAHKAIDCRECHKPDYIGDGKLKMKSKTYLGLVQKCASCHADVHQGTLANDCASCHTTEKFAPAGKFNHSNTDFALQGKHKTVECIDCHRKEIRNGATFQRFAGIGFDNCSSCHDDVHFNELFADCKTCHTEESFSQFVGMGRFDHKKTGFPLKGKHNKVDCFQCHSPDPNPLTVFEDRTGVLPGNCASCHQDVHQNKFGSKCSDCHTEESFRFRGNPGNFDHSLTDFKLVGKHRAVDCRDCHKEKLTDPLPHNYCASCHADFHKGEFVTGGVGPDCGRCHTPEGFDIPLYGIADHNQTQFKLEGAHAATPCFECHLKNNEWDFRGIGTKCVNCHKDVHREYLDAKFYPGQTCQNCHISTSWSDSRFDHNLTGYQLQGAHARQACSACHIKEETGNPVKFKGISSTCTACHEDEHVRQFEKNGVTRCEECHTFDNWDATRFDHDKAAFKLDGKHAKVACAGCHKETQIDGITTIQYKFKSFECADCHK